MDFLYVLLKIADLVLTVHLKALNKSYVFHDKYNFIMLYLVYQNTL